MKKKIFILSLAIGVSISSHAEVEISIMGYGTDDIHISTDKSKIINGESVSTDDNGNTNYIYVDKGSQIVNSTIGSTVIVDRKFTKEEGINHYSKKVLRYEDKIEKYHDKIDKYQDKILDKPRNKERYRNKINGYHSKINEYKNKILEAEIKLKEYQEMK